MRTFRGVKGKCLTSFKSIQCDLDNFAFEPPKRTVQGKRAVKELAQGEVPPLVLKKGTFLRFRDPNHYLN